jgi:IrrE N-terminal-like domain
VSEMLCRHCGASVILRSRFEQECTECGSDDLEPVDAYDPVEYELQCEYCGYEVDTSSRADVDWSSPEDDTPSSVDDPCPICSHALVPHSEARAIRDQPEYRMAREAARKLHRQHDIPGPPYDLETLSEDLGLEIHEGDFDHDGMLVDAVIEIPADATEAAKRFAVAHEIGHFVLRHEGDERRKVEPEANALASELLIPRDELKAAIATTPSLRALARKFGVSRQAMVYAVMAAKLIKNVQP